MPLNFEVCCPRDEVYAENRPRIKRAIETSLSSSESTAEASVQKLRTTTVPNRQHHPLVKKILQEVDFSAISTQVSGMKEAVMVAKIAQLLVGAMTLLRANINQINLVGLRVVRLFNIYV